MPQRSLQLTMAAGYAVLLALSAAVCWMTSLDIDDVGSKLLVVGIVCAAFSPIPVYWHDRGRTARRDAALVIPWSLLIAFTAPLPFLAGARLGMPLCDHAFATIDRWLGINGSTMTVWAAQHTLGRAINNSYNLLFPFLGLAIFVPALLGKREARPFLLANLIALGIGAVGFTLFPAIGPWVSENFTGTAQQLAIEAQVHTLRTSHAYHYSIVKDGAGIVSFPSFHVVWAVFAAYGLSGFRFLRVPLVMLAAIIIASTVTTGWHYGIDVLGGLALAAVSLACAHRWLGQDDLPLARTEPERSPEVLVEVV